MTTKLKCILLDDELPGLTYLRMLCSQIQGIEVVKAYNNPLRFVEEVHTLDFDFCILDIEMPGMNGLQVAQLIKAKPVIFTTAYKEYAADAFDLDAVDYVRKPINKERLEKAIAKIEKTLYQKSKEKQYIQLNTNKGKALLFFDQLLLVCTPDGDNRDKLALLENGQELLIKNMSFTALISQLPTNGFCRINKKEIISMRAVRFFTHDEITTTILDERGKERVLQLGDSFRKDFLYKATL